MFLSASLFLGEHEPSRKSDIACYCYDRDDRGHKLCVLLSLLDKSLEVVYMGVNVSVGEKSDKMEGG